MKINTRAGSMVWRVALILFLLVFSNVGWSKDWWESETWERACSIASSGFEPIVGGSNHDLLEARYKGKFLFADYVFDGQDLQCITEVGKPPTMDKDVKAGRYVIWLRHGSNRDIFTIYGLKTSKGQNPTVKLIYAHLLDGRINLEAITDDSVTIRYGKKPAREEAPQLKGDRIQTFCWDHKSGVWTTSDNPLIDESKYRGNTSPPVPVCDRPVPAGYEISLRLPPNTQRPAQ